VKLNRRTFLKLSAATASMAALGASKYRSVDNWASANERPSNITTAYSVCNSCGNRCGIMAYLRNGRLWRITGNPDDNKSGGKICTRGHGYAQMVYDKYRLSQPLKRTSDGSFVEIPWEQAYQEIGDKLMGVVRKYGPQSVFWSEYSKPISNFYGARLMAALGSPNWTTHSSTCFVGRNVGFDYTLGGLPSGDYENTKYVVFVGRSPADGMGLNILKGLGVAKKKGAKVVSVDPRLSYSAGVLADEWVAVKPGTDLALLLAWMNVLIAENLYDKGFVENYTVGFAELKEMVKQYTPEWAETITGVKAEQIRRIGRELGANRPAAFLEPGWHAAYGSNYANSTQTARATAIVNGLLGNINKPGGLCFYNRVSFGGLNPELYPTPPASPYERVDGAGVKGKYPLTLSTGLHHLLPGLAKEGKLKAGIFYSVNPGRTVPDRNYVIEGYKNLELTIVIDWQMSETAEQFADYVLPESHPMERDGIVEAIASSRPQVTMQAKVIDPVHSGGRGLDRIVSELATAMGLERFFNFTLEDLNKAMLFPLGLFPVHLKSRGIVDGDAGQWHYEFPVDGSGKPSLRTKSGKVEFFSSSFAEHGHNPLPAWQAPKVMPSGDKLRMIHGHQAYHTHAQTMNNPYLMSITKDYEGDSIWLNTETAKRLGISDGDTVQVSGNGWEAKSKVKVTQRIHPEALFVPGGYGGFAKSLVRGYGIGVNINDFLKHDTEPISGHAMMEEVLVSVKRA